MLLTRKFGEALDNVVKCACGGDARAVDRVRITSGRKDVGVTSKVRVVEDWGWC